MPAKPRFVQFSHPGKEHGPKTGQHWRRRTNSNGHRRKFMQFRGKWVDDKCERQSDCLWAWGEWEAESSRVSDFCPCQDKPRHPQHLWQPYYVPKDSYHRLHGTDPFIFGEQFLYSHCGQTNDKGSGLRNLGRGSVIAFGSGEVIQGKKKWVLDTVFVVADSIAYNRRTARTSVEECIRLKERTRTTLRDVVLGPLLDNSGEACAPDPCALGNKRLRLYLGATPANPVNDMFSFVPAVLAGGTHGFSRPCIDLPDYPQYFNPGHHRGGKGQGKDITLEDLSALWNQLVGQVRAAKLVLGTYAELPERRAK